MSGQWHVELPAMGGEIIVNYQQILEGLQQLNQIMGEVESGVQDVQQAHGLLAEIDTGDAASEFQQRAAEGVTRVNDANEQLRGAAHQLDNKVGEFSAAEAQQAARFG